MVIINMSGAYARQDFYKNSDHIWVDGSDIEETLYFCSDLAADIIRSRIKELPYQDIHYIDSGDYHYLSLMWMEKIDRPFILVLFDNHTDCQESAFGKGLLTCGSWVLRALEKLENLKAAIIIGPKDAVLDNDDISGKEKAVFDIHDERLCEKLKDVIGELPVYVSIDKDILTKEEAVTDWSQGSARLTEILDAVSSINNYSDILGADVCGEALQDASGDAAKADSINNNSNNIINNAAKGWINVTIHSHFTLHSHSQPA